MCKECIEICEKIEKIFGHKVEPKKLTELIESSPLVEMTEEDIKDLEKQEAEK